MSVREAMFADEQWEKVKPFIPPSPPRPKGGRPPADDRLCFEGSLWILKTGARWKDLPRQYASPATCWRRLREWYETDVLKDMWRAFLSELDHEGILEWDEVFVDASFIPAKKGARQSERPKGESNRVALSSIFFRKLEPLRIPDKAFTNHAVYDRQQLPHASR